jgi:hypothetical protein
MMKFSTEEPPGRQKPQPYREHQGPILGIDAYMPTRWTSDPARVARIDPHRPWEYSTNPDHPIATEW